MGFYHRISLEEYYIASSFGRLKQSSVFHVLLSEWKSLKSAPCLVSSPRVLTLVADWLILCQPSNVIGCHFGKKFFQILFMWQPFSDPFYFRPRKQGALFFKNRDQLLGKVTINLQLPWIFMLPQGLMKPALRSHYVPLYSIIFIE